jgi:ribulose-phosphate 3-epimerase
MHDALPGTTRPFEIIPSVLPADFSRLGDACRDLEQAGVDRIQFDIMDGRFVPNLTFGPDVVASLRPHVGVPFEAHLMVEEPGWMYRAFVDAGCDMIIVHAESVGHLHRTLDEVRSAGARAAVALNPVGAVGGPEGGSEVTLRFQLLPPLLSQVPAPLLKTRAIVVASAGTV